MLSAIVLAAGESKRFGSPKQLYKINNKTLIETAIDTLAQAQIDQIIVVLGAHRELIVPVIPKNITIAINKIFHNGQTSSIQCGLKKISSASAGALILPVDCALIAAQTITALITQFNKLKPLVAIPAYGARKGHPPLYAAKIIPDILALNYNEPLYTINRKFTKETLLVEVDDANILKNINTPHDA